MKDNKPWYEKVNIWIGIVAGIFAILGISIFGSKSLIGNIEPENTSEIFKDNEISMGNQSMIVIGGNNTFNYERNETDNTIEDKLSTSNSDDNDDIEFITEVEVRLLGSEDKEWHKNVTANIGDRVEFLIGYYNTSNLTQNEVAVRDFLSNNLQYIKGTTVLRNSNHIDGVIMDSNKIAEGGIRIGSYSSGANAYITFTAEVVNNNLEYGDNLLYNFAQCGVDCMVNDDYATVSVVFEDDN